MNAAIERLVSRYETGALTRREFVTAIAALASGGLAGAQAPKPQLPVRTLNHVTLFVSNVERSVTFYQQLFDLPVMSRQDNGINLAAGESFVGIYAAPGANGANGANSAHINHFCLGVERFNADETMKVCAEHGVESRIRMRGDVKELYFADPDGISVQLQDVSYRG